MWIVGGEIYGWYDTTLELHSLKLTTWYMDWADADKLEAVAKVESRAVAPILTSRWCCLAGQCSLCCFLRL
jgi:hypothetical protein